MLNAIDKIYVFKIKWAKVQAKPDASLLVFPYNELEESN